MITVDFEKRGTAGLCEYLVDSLKKQILENRLAAEEKLPSKRALASHLGISVITVQNAYNRLIDEGYIYSIEKKGFFVTEITPVSAKTGRLEEARGIFPTGSLPQGRTFPGRLSRDSMARELREIRPVPDARGPRGAMPEVRGVRDERRQPEAQQAQEFFTDFQSNSTLSEKFPFNLWAKVSRQVLNTGNESLLRRQDVFGVKELRRSIAEYLLEFRDMDVSEWQILIGSGTESLYSMLVQFLGRKKHYAIEEPGYAKVAHIFRLEGARCRAIPIDEEGMNPQLLKHEDVIHISPSHHYPTGIVTPIRRRNELLNWANEKDGRYIIEDDYDSEFRFSGKPLPTLQSRDFTGKVIYINTFSKTLAPSFRISYMVIPRGLVGAFHEKFRHLSCQVNAFEQFTLAHFIDGGFYSKHIIRMKNYYRTLRNELISALKKSKFSSIGEIHEEDSGLHFLLTLRTYVPAEVLKERLAQQRLRIPLLREYYHDETHVRRQAKAKAGLVTFVLNYSGIQKSRITETVKRMEKAFLGAGLP